MENSWPMMTTSMLAPHRKPEEVSSVDINSLLGGRKFGQDISCAPFEMNPTVPDYPMDEIKELEEYCARRGIIGVNFGKMSPRAALQMLKAKVGYVEHEKTTKKGIIHG